MKFAIIADVHANLEALQAVLDDAAGQRCTRFAFLGDLVGYCADPKACLDLIRSMGATCVQGNHDEYCAADTTPKGVNPTAAKAIAWTRKQLVDGDRHWLRNLPHVETVEDFTVVHATLARPEKWEYVFDSVAAADSLAYQNTQICFYGHTHVPVAFVRDTGVRGVTYTKFKLEAGKRYLVNPGSVGQPRDNNPTAAYVIHDLDEASVELRRLPFDFTETQRKIREAGLMD
jgi:predicted phosphodiesterase